VDVRRAGEVPEELLYLGGEVLRRVLADTERAPYAVGEADRAPEPHVDPARGQRLQYAELLRHDERVVVRQHHAAGADPDPIRAGGNSRGQHCRRGADHSWHAVVLRHPETLVTKLFHLLSEIDGRPQRLRLGLAGPRP